MPSRPKGAAASALRRSHLTPRRTSRESVHRGKTVAASCDRLPPEVHVQRGNMEGTPAGSCASTRGYSSSADAFGLRDLRGRRDPRLPSLPAPDFDGKEGVDGSTGWVMGSAKGVGRAARPSRPPGRDLSHFPDGHFKELGDLGNAYAIRPGCRHSRTALFTGCGALLELLRAWPTRPLELGLRSFEAGEIPTVRIHVRHGGRF